MLRIGLVMCCVLGQVLGANILAVFPHTGKSHFDVFEPLVLALATRGHLVTVVSFYPQKAPVANLTDISLVGLAQLRINKVQFNDIQTPFNNFISKSYMGLEMCEKILRSPEMAALFQPGVKFDILIIEFFYTNCFFSLANKFSAPFIAIAASSIYPDQEDRVGNPWIPAMVSNPALPYSSSMTLRQKLYSIVYSLATRLVRAYISYKEQTVVEGYFGKMSSLESIAHNVSLVLINAHLSMLRPRPLVPGLVEVGGIHIKPLKPLEKELETYLEESTNGVILFSMGSVIQSSSFPVEKRQGIMDAFAELPVRVLMKWESDTLPGKPDNVRLSKWLPQRDILAHPKVVAFMGHGGMLSTSEALYCGVPMVLIPMFGDQPNNVAHLSHAGAAVKLSYNELSKETVLEALRSVLYNPRYREKAQELSAQFKDRPMSPLDTAVYWTEYVIRHKGAPHLRSPAVDMPWYQLWLLDVILVLFAGLTTLLFLVYWLAKRITSLIYTLLFCRKTKTKND